MSALEWFENIGELELIYIIHDIYADFIVG